MDKELKTFTPVEADAIDSDPRASVLKEQVLKILQKDVVSKEAPIDVLNNLPITIIYGPEDHWVNGVVLVGYTGVEVEFQRLPEDDGCLLTVKTGEDGDEKIMKKQIQIMDRAIPIKCLDTKYSDFESIGVLERQINGASSGSLRSMHPSYRCNLPNEGEFTVSQSILVLFSEKACNKFTYPNKLGKSPFYVTAVTPVKK